MITKKLADKVHVPASPPHTFIYTISSDTRQRRMLDCWIRFKLLKPAYKFSVRRYPSVARVEIKDCGFAQPIMTTTESLAPIFPKNFLQLGFRLPKRGARRGGNGGRKGTFQMPGFYLAGRTVRLCQICLTFHRIILPPLPLCCIRIKQLKNGSPRCLLFP